MKVEISLILICTCILLSMFWVDGKFRKLEKDLIIIKNEILRIETTQIKM